VTFQGNLADRLGIKDTFDADKADRLFRGMKPDLVDGKEQKLTARLDKDRVMGWDWTFNTPKEFGLIHHLGGDDRLLGIHARAVQKAMRYVEKHARVRVRKQSEIAREKSLPKVHKAPAY